MPCLNARDAAVAGSVIAHQLLTVAMEMTPQSDTGILNSLQTAQITLAKAQVYTSNLALSTAQEAPPSGTDLQQLGFAAIDTLNLIKNAQKIAVGNNGNSGFEFNSSQPMDPIVGQIAIVTANGPIVVNEQM